LKKLNILVIRVNSKNELVNSKPCENCIYYLRLYGIKNVYYSNENGEIVKEKITDIENEHQSISHARYNEYLDTNSDEIIKKFDDRYRRRKSKSPER
jgi:deoxycytidylate deaminase